MLIGMYVIQTGWPVWKSNERRYKSDNTVEGDLSITFSERMHDYLSNLSKLNKLGFDCTIIWVCKWNRKYSM